MSHEEQTIELLREIRDIQREHFDYYRVFTENLAKVNEGHQREWQLERERTERYRQNLLGTRIGSIVIAVIGLLLVIGGIIWIAATK